MTRLVRWPEAAILGRWRYQFGDDEFVDGVFESHPDWHVIFVDEHGAVFTSPAFEPGEYFESLDAVPASVPEPPPVDAGDEVTPALRTWLHQMVLSDHIPLPAFHSAMALVISRDAYGSAKYGQPLRVGDGRNTIEDLRQELGDALQYAFKARMQGADLRGVLPLIEILKDVCTKRR